MTEPRRVSLDELAHDRQQMELERQHESFAPSGQEREDWIEKRIEELLRHAPTRSLQEFVGESLVNREPEICNAIADGNEKWVGEIVAKAVRDFVRSIAESDYETALPQIVADNAEDARTSAEAGEWA